MTERTRTVERDATVIGGPRYVVVIDRERGIIFRVPKLRVGLMRFGREPEYVPRRAG